MRFPSVRCSVVSLLALTLAGCTSGGEGGQARLPVYRVSGKITLNGAPVPNATVSFSPQTKEVPAAFGTTNDQGEYTLTTYDGGDGAAAGDFKVLVTKASAPAASGPEEAHDPEGKAAPGTDAMHAGQRSDAPTSALPSKYADQGQSGLTATVKPEGPNTFDFNLMP